MMMELEKIIERAKRIRYFLMDVDGVLTNGIILISATGDETVGFSIYDGLGFSLLNKANIGTGWISGRNSPSVARRATELGIETYYRGIANKIEPYNEILCKYHLKDDEVAYMGDDVIDLPILRRVGLAVSVPNAVDTVKREAHWVTQKRGGEGAVRELIDFLLQAQEKDLSLCLS